MRKFNDTELSLLRKVANRKGRRSESRKLLFDTIESGKATVAFQKNGYFTTAVIKTENNLYIGTAKRMPEDKSNPVVGQNLALSRALKSKPVGIQVS
ncbi:MAG TPA: hypothetical protein PLP33_14570 [Leptospiraceae bacterium]|nr:hypothetical protein [Leptospiraceae bacterium]